VSRHDDYEEAGNDDDDSGADAGHTVTGGGGLRLHVREWGRGGQAADPVHPRLVAEPHVLGQAVRGPAPDEFRLVAYDLARPWHVEAPPGPGPYTDATLWADDLAASSTS
jgi:hypothetical protein